MRVLGTERVIHGTARLAPRRAVPRPSPTPHPANRTISVDCPVQLWVAGIARVRSTGCTPWARWLALVVPCRGAGRVERTDRRGTARVNPKGPRGTAAQFVSWVFICAFGVGHNIELIAQGPRIVLELEATWSPPPGFAPTKVFLSPNGATLLYDQASRRFVSLDSTLHPFAEGAIPARLDPVALFVTPRGRMELITRDPPHIALLSASGQLVRHTPIDIDGYVIDATFAPDLGWAALFRTANTSYTIGIQHPDSSEWSFMPVEGFSISAESPVYMTLNPAYS